MMHSQYLLEGVQHGLAAIRSDRRQVDGEAQFDREPLTRERMDETLRELAQLAWDVGKVHIELTGWVRD